MISRTGITITGIITTITTIATITRAYASHSRSEIVAFLIEN
jgi:hypothetical protein